MPLDPDAEIQFAAMIGAAKAGTTSLYRLLNEHEEICFPVEKEPDFFSKDEVYEKGIEFYRSLFNPSDRSRVVLDGSTTYARLPAFDQAASRIANHFPAARIIYLMREPVSRTWSHYLHRKRWSGSTESFKEMCHNDPSIKFASNYAAHLDQYLDHFPADQVHCLFYEELIADTENVTLKILEHLGLEGEGFDATSLPRENRGNDNDLRAQTTMRFRRLPGMQQIVDRLPDGIREIGFKAVKGISPTRPSSSESLSEESKLSLHELYSESNERLRSMLGRDLPPSWG